VDPGISTVGVSIRKNICGIIGFATVVEQSAFALATRMDHTQGLDISGNSCKIIATVYNMITGATWTGTQIHANLGTSSINTTTGSAHIHNNNAHWINVTAAEAAPALVSQIQITNNRLTAYDSTFLNQWSPIATLSSHAISVQNPCILTTSDAVVSGNMMATGRYNSTDYFYDVGIFSHTSCSITNNLIKGLVVTTGVGIDINATGVSDLIAMVSNNKIYREGNTITRYIRLPSLGGAGGSVENNFFDDYTIDGTDIETITGDASRAGSAGGDLGWSVHHNKNHQEIIELVDVGWVSGETGIIVRNNTGAPTVESFIQVSDQYTDNLLAGTSDTPAVVFDYESTDGFHVVNWLVNLSTCLPLGVKLIDAEIDASETVSSTTTLFFRASNAAGTLLAQDAGPLPPPASVATFTLSTDGAFATGDRTNTASNRLRIQVQAQAQTTDTAINFSSIRVTYRW
jgi:hypothetical protein